MNIFSLTGKTILVTGASSGIGRAIAIECSKAGAQIILVARNRERLNETLSNLNGEGHIAIEANLTDGEAIKSLLKSIDAVDGAVLCAGISKMMPVKFADRDSFNQVFDVNFFSTVELSRLLVKNKKIKKGGSIVLMDSIGGVYIHAIGNSIYGTSKAALNSFSKFAAREFKPMQIRVNCICPGMIETPLIHRGGGITQEEMDKDMEHYIQKRYGHPEEVAYGAIYLLSDASTWVTGTSLVIDGGVSI